MNTFLILKSNPIELDYLAVQIKENIDNAIVYQTTHYETAVSYANNHTIQFFLLDAELEMDDSDALTGIDFGIYIRSLPQYEIAPIIYISGSSEKIADAVNHTHCYKYLSEPYNTDNIISAIKTLLHTSLIKPLTINIRNSDGIYYRLYNHDITLIEASGKEMILYYCHPEETQQPYTNSISKVITIQYRLKDLKQLLFPDFMQCHKKYLINMNHVKTFDKKNNYIQVGDSFIPIGRTYMEIVENFFHKLPG